MSDSLKSYNELRLDSRKKPEEQENFLKKMNMALQSLEEELYTDAQPDFPLLYVVGLPRSGTTFCTQVLQKGFSLGYINNLAARFWLAPVSGIRLARQALGSNGFTNISSDYASTEGLSGIHEFGYFWRKWLQLEEAEHFRDYHERATLIDWPGLSRTLNNILLEAGNAMVMKNNFGGFYMDKLLESNPSAFFIFIERDPVDVAISILDARQKFFGSIDTWWATMPPDYFELKNLPPHEQIAGQIRSLDTLYRSQIESAQYADRKILIRYADLSSNPLSVLKEIRKKVNKAGGSPLAEPELRHEFKTRAYSDRPEETKIFKQLLSW